MITKTIKISEQNYIWLLNLAAEMQKKLGRPVSFDDTLNVIKEKKMKKISLLDLAGSWKMSDSEAEKLKKDLRKRWKNWKIESV